MVKRVRLDNDSLDYLKSFLLNSVIGQGLLQLPLEQGEIITYAPPEISIDRLKQYKNGGIGSWLEIRQKMGSIIIDYLSQESNDLCVIIRNFANTPQELQKEGYQEYPILLYNDEVYYPIGQGEKDIDKVMDIVQCASMVYYYFGIMTHYQWGGQFTDTLTDQDIDHIVEGVEMIFTSAYDNEGFIIWKRKK